MNILQRIFCSKTEQKSPVVEQPTPSPIEDDVWEVQLLHSDNFRNTITVGGMKTLEEIKKNLERNGFDILPVAKARGF